MTEPEFTAASANGAIEAEPMDATASEPEGGASQPVQQTYSLAQFLPILLQLQSTQRCLTAPPTFVPQTFQDQVQFVYSGGEYYLYLYFNNQWNSFNVSGGGVTQLLAGTGISISPSGGTGTVTITNAGVTSIVAGPNISISGATGAVTISASLSGSAISTVSGTDSASGQTVPFTTTHTITHGLGKRPTIITFNTDIFDGIPVVGSNTTHTYQSGWIQLDTNGNSIGGIGFTHFESAGTGTILKDCMILTNTLTGSITTSPGGTGTATVTINNVTDTTFDIVYSGSIDMGSQSGT